MVAEPLSSSGRSGLEAFQFAGIIGGNDIENTLRTTASLLTASFPAQLVLGVANRYSGPCYLQQRSRLRGRHASAANAEKERRKYSLCAMVAGILVAALIVLSK